MAPIRGLANKSKHLCTSRQCSANWPVLGNIAMIAIILISGVQGVTQSRIDMLYGLSLLAGVNMGVAVIEAIVTAICIIYRKSETRYAPRVEDHV